MRQSTWVAAGLWLVSLVLVLPGVARGEGPAHEEAKAPRLEDLPLQPSLPAGARRRLPDLGHIQGPLACTAKGQALGIFEKGIYRLTPTPERLENESKLLKGTSAELSPDGRWLVSMPAPGTFSVVELESGRSLPGLDLAPGLAFAKFSSDGNHLALQRNWSEKDGARTAKKEIVVHDARSGRRLGLLEGYEYLRWVSGDGAVVMAKKGGRFSLVDVKSGEDLLPKEALLPTNPAQSADGKLLAVATKDGAKLFRMPAKTEIARYKTTRPVTGLAISPDGNFLVVTELGRHTIYEAETGKRVGELLPGAGSQTQPGVFCGSSRFFVATTITELRPPGALRGAVPAKFEPPSAFLYDLAVAPGLSGAGVAKDLAPRLAEEARGADPVAAWRALFELSSRKHIGPKALGRLFTKRAEPSLSEEERHALDAHLAALAGRDAKGRVRAASELPALLRKMSAAEVQARAVEPLRRLVAGGDAATVRLAGPVLAVAEARLEAGAEVLRRRESWLLGTR